jgi:hypothetical protein
MARSEVLSFVKRQRQVWIVAIMAAFAGAAGAQVKVDAPANNSDVNSPFYLRADSPTCQSQPTATMTYPIDYEGDAPTQHVQSLQAEVAGVANGTHTLHVTAWNGMGRRSAHNAVPLIVGDGLNVSARDLTWSDFIGPNSQLDGQYASGTSTAYVDNFSVFYWLGRQEDAGT